ncbi:MULTISPECIES: MBL fold metallo-hydrolase [unclassified Microbacterium]|uniref:MBL fold metallo-hydrolase n=1 Tax=Microbacterium TaxID=33882 RepID=UPI003B9E4F5C
MTALSLSARHPGQFLVVGGPTVVFDLAGLRFVTDPTFDPPTDYGFLRKTQAPTHPAEAFGDVDVVLVSHSAHADNLDHAGRAFALNAPVLLTNPSAAADLGNPAQGIRPWESIPVTGDVEVTAVPAQHGPADGQRDEDGFVNCEVTGFVIRTPDTTTYVSGDNASLGLVTQIRERVGAIDHAVLFAGRASVPAKFDGRPLSLTAERAAAAAEVLGAPHVIVAHQTGWAHFTQGPADTARAFQEAGISDRLDPAEPGRWSTR